MTKQEILDYCLEKNVLLDNSLLNALSLFEDVASIKILLEKIKNFTGKSFINKNLILSNKFTFKKFLDELSINRNIDFSKIIEEYELEDLENSEKKEIKKNKEKIVGEGLVKIVRSNPTVPKSLEVKDFTIHFRNRYNDIKEIMQNKPEFENLISINKIPFEKQKFSIIGMVNSKKTTKNGNVMLEIEDLAGRIKVLINSNKEELMKEAEDITLDSVIGFKGLGNRDILFVNEVYFPDSRLEERKKAEVEECVLFLGDLHYGSRNFLKKDFVKFINYLSEDNKENEEAAKIKYLFLVGDLITGVGNYPNQENDLVIVDLEEQFMGLADHLKKIRKDIKIIITPGNHDCVRLMEPQPVLDEKFAWPLYELENVIVAENPSVINIGKRNDFPGFEVLSYHGFSYPYYANNIPKLMKGNTMNDPIKIMNYLLKNRHLAPTHGSTQYFPSEKDSLLIRKIPDIFVSGHTHKSGVFYHNNILVVSISSWEGMTPYQEKFGNEPDHCKVPMFNLKTRQVKILDFEVVDEEETEIKRFREQKNNLKIAIDLDDTIWKFHKGFFEYYNDKFGTNHSEEDYRVYSLEEFLNISKEEVSKLLDEFAVSDFEEDLDLMEGVKETILKLKEKHNIYFMTARHEGLAEPTIKKLKDIFGIDFPIFFVFDENRNLIKEKVDYCLDKGVDVIVDDRLKTLKMCAEKGVKGFLMNQKWNEEGELQDKIQRVNNWNEILVKIGEIENEYG